MLDINIKLIPPRNLAKQVLFAASQALNDAAFDTRKALAASLPKSFTIRTKHPERSLRVKKARPRQLTAIVGSKAEYLADQVVGGRRRGAAVPSRKLRGSKNRVIRKPRWPRGLLSKEKHFAIRPSSGRRLPGGLSRHQGRNELLVLRRMGRGGRKLRLQWVVLKSGQRVKPRWPFESVAEKAFQASLPRHFPRRLREALRSAK